MTDTTEAAQDASRTLYEQITDALAGIVTPELAGITAAVLTRADAYDALDYVQSIEEGGPDCACGRDHWSCDWPENPGDDDDAGNDAPLTADEIVHEARYGGHRD